MSPSSAPPGSGEIVRIRDEKWRVVRRLDYDGTTLVEVAGCDATNHSRLTRFLLPFETVERLDAPTTPRVVSRGRWRQIARHLLAEAPPSWASLRAAARADLRLIPFQLEPALALVRGDGCRFLIADAVGLGKTVQGGLMIAEVLQRHSDARALVISPAALREQWRQELGRRFHLDAEVLDAAGIARLSSHLPPGVNPWSVRRVVIASIDYIKRPEVLRSLEALTWDLVVFDEAHNLTGRSDRARAAGAIGDRARALALLTATPHSGDDEAFARLCSVGSITGAHPLLVFRRTRADAGIHRCRRDTMLRVRPTAEEAAMHDALMVYARLVWRRSSDSGRSGAQLAMSVLARRACSSAASLARSVERRIGLLASPTPEPASQIDLPFQAADCDDDEPQAALGSPGLPDAGEERAHLLRLLDLARGASRIESKLAALRRLIRRAREPVIVFTEYRDTLRRLAAVFADFETVQLHGGQTMRERADALNRFTGGAARLLMATDAASEGLNLHHRCRLVIDLELPWTPLRLEQRAGRVDRIGQTRTVHAVHFVAAGTCEETTLLRLTLRIARMQGALGLSSPLPNERRVAESVLGDRPDPDLDVAATTPVALLIPNLRREAHDEARHITSARGLQEAGAEPPADGRGVITLLRRRGRARPRRRCFWTFRIGVSTASGQVVWEPLVALTASVEDAVRIREHDIRQILGRHHPAIERVLDIARDQVLGDVRRTIGPPVDLGKCRERDLMDALRDRHARLSSGLLQRSLFDRRHERLAASQRALVDEALSHSARRLRDLAALDALRVESCDLAFAVVVE